MTVANGPISNLSSALVRLQLLEKCPSATDRSKNRSTSRQGSIRCSGDWSAWCIRRVYGCWVCLAWRRSANGTSNCCLPLPQWDCSEAWVRLCSSVLQNDEIVDIYFEEKNHQNEGYAAQKQFPWKGCGLSIPEICQNTAGHGRRQHTL